VRGIQVGAAAFAATWFGGTPSAESRELAEYISLLTCDAGISRLSSQPSLLRVRPRRCVGF